MTVKELKQTLENVPDDMDVFFQQTNTEYPLSMVTEAEIKRVPFYDESDEELEGEDDVFLITDN
jgi:hypothetical protein